MIQSEKLKKAIATIDNISIRNVMKQFRIIKQDVQQIEGASPSDILLDGIIQISQNQKSGKTKKVEFRVCDKWLKPTNVFSVILKDKEKKDSNIWILFFDSNTWYIRKGLKAPSTVHVKVISSSSKD